MTRREEIENRMTKLNNEKFYILMADRLRPHEWKRLDEIDTELHKLRIELKNM